MTQALFKVGACYRSKGGDVMRVEHVLDHARQGSHYFSVARLGLVFSHDGSRYMDGSYFGDPNDEASLIPGELHNFNGEWLPVEEKAEQPRAPYFAEAVESEWVSLGCTCGDHPADLAMIARDGPQITRPAPPPVAQEATSHAPLAGLTVLMERDHRFGSCVVHGE